MLSPVWAWENRGSAQVHDRPGHMKVRWESSDHKAQLHPRLVRKTPPPPHSSIPSLLHQSSNHCDTAILQNFHTYMFECVQDDPLPVLLPAKPSSLFMLLPKKLYQCLSGLSVTSLIKSQEVPESLLLWNI